MTSHLNLGGGAEAHARNRQYEYTSNSSLVVTTGSRSRDTHEPTGEPESLRGRLDPKSFGDRVCRGRPEGEIGKKRDGDGGGGSIRRKRRRVEEQKSVLSETEEGVYRPKTRETQAAYEALLGVIQQQLGGQPPSVVCGAADEVFGSVEE